MSKSESRFELPKHIERHLAALSRLYGQEGERQKQEIIVNAQVRVHEEWSRDNWDGGIYGHALYLLLPENIYLASVRQKDDLQNQIRADINKIHNVQNEFIEEVFLEMEMAEGQDWRRDSGLLQPGKRIVPVDAANRIWGDGGYRVFLSHKAEVKKEAAALKERLHVFDVSCFVAHQDIHPTKEWQDEIENALDSMDAFVALMTETFHDSDWTDQEVGFAFGRRVPLIAAKLGRDPYGFIGKFQALRCTWETAPKGIVGLLITHPRMLDAYIAAVQSCTSFDSGNLLATILPHIDHIAEEQTNKLVLAFNENADVRGSYGFNGKYPAKFGPGLATYLSRATDRKYVVRPSGEMEVVP